MIWHKGIVSNVDAGEAKDGKKRYKISYYEGDENGYQENDIEVEFGKDGSMSFVDYNRDSGSIYLYPEQVIHLRKLMSGKEPGERSKSYETGEKDDLWENPF